MFTRRVITTAVSATFLLALVFVISFNSGSVRNKASSLSWPSPGSPASDESLGGPEEALNPDEPPHPRYKTLPNVTALPIQDNFPLAEHATSSLDLPPIPSWNRPKHVAISTPLFIGFTRNWPILQQAVVSYITAGWPPEDIYVVDNTGTMDSNRRGKLTLQNPFYLNYHRLTQVYNVNVITTPTLLSFAQLQNFYLATSLEKDWAHYFWSHMDVIAISDEKLKPFSSLYHRAVEALQRSIDPAAGKWAIRFFAYDRLALVNAAAYVDVGGWDTMIPYYGTDCDMHERLGMAGYEMTDVGAGFVYDVGTSLPDLNMLYRPADAECTEGSADEYGIGDCRYDALIRRCEEIQGFKNEHEGGRNFWQGEQIGGQSEPYYRDPQGFQIALQMTIDNGMNVMAEKWGHRGCGLAGSGLRPDDAWRVLHDWD